MGRTSPGVHELSVNARPETKHFGHNRNHRRSARAFRLSDFNAGRTRKSTLGRRTEDFVKAEQR